MAQQQTQYPIITIITSNFKQGEFLERTMRSVLEQYGAFYLDYLIFDANSPDNSWEVVAKWQAEIAATPVVHRVGEVEFHDFLLEMPGCAGVSLRAFRESDKGQYDGINKGLKVMVGDYWGYLNGDDILEPGALQKVAVYFQKWPDVDMIYGQGLYINERDEFTGLYPSFDIERSRLIDNCFISQPSAFLRREIFAKLGGFNINIKNSADYEYWLRVQKAGFKIRFVRDVLSSTRIHSSTKTNVNRTSIRNEILGLTQHYAGYLPYRWKVEFSRETMLLARFFDLMGQVFYKLRTKTANLYARFYGRGLKGVAESEEKRIFGKPESAAIIVDQEDKIKTNINNDFASDQKVNETETSDL
jgi:glycosyltransferase involved in cell wall biosynthesis